MFGERTVAAEVERIPAVACTSSTVTPTPCSGPHTWPRASAWSASGAAARPVRVQGNDRTKPGVVPLDPVELLC